MYTLRAVDGDGTSNHSLGSFYSTVNRFENTERFRELFQEVFKTDHVADLDESSTKVSKNTIGFVIGNNDWIIPVDQRESTYIVNENGSTLERLNTVMLRKQRAREKSAS